MSSAGIREDRPTPSTFTLTGGHRHGFGVGKRRLLCILPRVDLRTQAIIARLLANLGSRSEVEQYLKHYGAVATPRAAVIQVTGEVLERSMDDVASSLAFLGAVGLQPIVVHGAGPQIAAALHQRGVPQPPGRDPNAVATPEALGVARRAYLRTNNQLLVALEQLGVRARSITAGVFRGEPGKDGRFGLGGQPLSLDQEPINWAREAGALPVISALGETPKGEILSLDSAAAARTLAGIIRPHKLIFLNMRGGIARRDGSIISAVNLSEDYEQLMALDDVHPEVKKHLTALYELLDELPRESSVSFTSPSQLARELFTHTGAGTLVRIGAHVREYQGFDDVDRIRLRALLEDCFGKRLSSTYFQDRIAQKVYISDDYRAVAILVDIGGDTPYLDKFAVTEVAKGEGLGASVWRRIRCDQPKLFWRARRDNPVNPWYFRNAQGSFQGGEWVVFWYGFTDFVSAKDCVDRALALPATFDLPSPKAGLSADS
ncbi:MAG: acetylglutamate kinase [Myxococcales bacterium]|nr:acetylglutamate kinase [Myxococcales bacterium]